MSQKLTAAIAVIGIDIGKNSFHIVGHECGCILVDPTSGEFPAILSALALQAICHRPGIKPIKVHHAV